MQISTNAPTSRRSPSCWPFCSCLRPSSVTRVARAFKGRAQPPHEVPSSGVSYHLEVLCPLLPTAVWSVAVSLFQMLSYPTYTRSVNLERIPLSSLGLSQENIHAFHMYLCHKLFIHLSFDRHVWAVSIFWLVWVLLWTCVYMYLPDCLSICFNTSDRHLGMGLQAHMVILCLTFWGKTHFFLNEWPILYERGWMFSHGRPRDDNTSSTEGRTVLCLDSHGLTQCLAPYIVPNKN